MAIVVGDQVALHRASAATLGARGNVLFGTAIDVASGVNVVWENGAVAEAIPQAQLDKILGDDTLQKVCTFTDADAGAQSPEYESVVVRRYSRQQGGEGSLTDFILMRSISTGQLYEALLTNVEFLDGR